MKRNTYILKNHPRTLVLNIPNPFGLSPNSTQVQNALQVITNQWTFETFYLPPYIQQSIHNYTTTCFM